MSTEVNKKEDFGPSAAAHEVGAPTTTPELAVHDEHEPPQVVPKKAKPVKFLEYMKTKDFWIAMALGQILSLCNIGSATFSSLMAMNQFSIPAFQSLLLYICLNIGYTGFTLYKYGFKKWAQMILKDGWRYFILAFLDVEGNYFIVLAYRYTTLLSGELFVFWTVIVVVLISFFLLGVRYHLTQYFGVIVCCCGMGLVIASDHLRGADFPGQDKVKGDLFALLASTFYGFSNCFQEFLVSKRPVYEVVGQLGFWGMWIIGVQAAIFDRGNFEAAVWSGKVGGYLAGFTIMLIIFYSVAPVMLRLSSATFFNISLLTMNFWALIIGLEVFGLKVHFLYPIAFVMIVLGLFVYFISEPLLGDAQKPWLGENQEKGVVGLGTARRERETGAAIV